MAPRDHKIGRAPPGAPKMAQERPKTPQDGAQDGPRAAEGAPRRPKNRQVGPKSAPRAAQESIRVSKRAKKPDFNDFGSDFGVPGTPKSLKNHSFPLVFLLFPLPMPCLGFPTSPVGFSMLLFSAFLPTYQFGILSAGMIGAALICDLTLLPALCLVLPNARNKSK